jgi:hypothetical protein
MDIAPEIYLLLTKAYGTISGRLKSWKDRIAEQDGIGRSHHSMPGGNAYHE